MRLALRAAVACVLVPTLAAVPGYPQRAEAEPGGTAPPAASVASSTNPTEPATPTSAPAKVAIPPTADEAEAWGAIEVAGAHVEPGERGRGTIRVGAFFSGSSVAIGVLVARGIAPGPTVCLTAGVHGDEITGVEVVRRLMNEVDPTELAGTLIGVPIASPHAFQRRSRYLPDRRDLNRSFPGRESGSVAARVANALFEMLIDHCSVLVDSHSGSFHRTNLPQVRADMEIPEIALLARHFGSAVIVDHPGRLGTLRRSATDHGLPSITYEAGEPLRLRESEITPGVEGVLRLLMARDMLAGIDLPEVTPEILPVSVWVRADDAGLLLGKAGLGERVLRGDLLGWVVDPVTSLRSEIRSPYDGRVVGLALDQTVMPGFAVYHLGLAESEADQHDEGDDSAEEVPTVDGPGAPTTQDPPEE